MSHGERFGLGYDLRDAMRRLRLHSLLIWTLACWQALLLIVCVPSASAHRAPERPAAHACCAEQPTPAPRPAAELACPHCSDGHGRFVDAAAPAAMLAPDALVERVTLAPIVAAAATTFVEERPILRPPDPSLFALRCALIR